MECLLPYLCMVTVPHIMVVLERMLDYRGVRLARFHCTYVHIFMYVSTISYIHMYVYVYIHKYVYVHTQYCTYVHTYIRMSTIPHIHTYVHLIHYIN